MITTTLQNLKFTRIIVAFIFITGFINVIISISHIIAQKLVLPGLEPGTFRVLSERDNHYTTELLNTSSNMQKIEAQSVHVSHT